MSSADHGLRRGLYLAPFDELADPRALVDLAVRAEEHGWDGFFLWDHILWRPPVRAIAAHTERLRLGPLVTPLSRRRVHKVARETATLDHLSQGRLILGVGLGANSNGELDRFDENRRRPRTRAGDWRTIPALAVLFEDNARGCLG
jgi:alkanesulfonate monooxygenase SsuD/methylene tetrahydromethanopterin reductase-like flavin-dependent oxidoreductase (luciferase family)